MKFRHDQPREILIATRNQGKLREITAILSPLGWKILSLNNFPDIPPVPEDGATFGENAEKKAREVARRSGKLTLADDSGLMVDALQGRPGVISSRYAGESATDEMRCQKILAEMAGVPEEKRGAAFICTLALVSADGDLEIIEGQLRGRIAFAPRGANGFGYDPIFLLPDLGKTVAEISPDLKNQISHRAQALQKLKVILSKLDK